jgi:hypothetical protein
MRAGRSSIVWSIALVLALVPATAGAQPCFVVKDDTPAPDVAAPEVDVRQIIELTPAGAAALGSKRFAYVQIVRQESRAFVGNQEVVSAPETFVRLLDGTPKATRFTFGRKGAYTLQLLASAQFAWPAPASMEPVTTGCDVVEVAVADKVRRPDFTGARAQWWGAYRVPTSVELGGSIFAGRIGVAASAELRVSRLIGSRDDPDNLNPVVGALELRYRGSRGYLGGGVRYYAEDEPDREHVRFVFVAGEELPSFRGRPMWLLVDIRLEDPQKNFLKGLRPSVGIRFDLWGSRP